MAALVCWASGLLQVLPLSEVDQTPSGPVTLMTGTAGKLTSVIAAHAERCETLKGWIVPGTQSVPTEGRETGAIHQDRMTLVILFGKKINNARLKNKGLKHLKESLE